MARVYLSLGSNIQRQQHILAALNALNEYFGELQVSSVYESEAIGFVGDPFLNMVVGLETNLTVGRLSEYLKALEDRHGRRRDCSRFSGRTLDIDILTYDQCAGVVDGVTLPRGEIVENAFVLWPLAELAPTELHPLVDRSYGDLWQDYGRNRQTLWPVPFFWRGVDLSALASDRVEGL